MIKKKQNPFLENKFEILYHIINAFLAAGLVLAGAFTSGAITKPAIIIALIAAVIVVFTKFRDYWTGQEKAYSKCLTFIPC